MATHMRMTTMPTAMPIFREHGTACLVDVVNVDSISSGRTFLM